MRTPAISAGLGASTELPSVEALLGRLHSLEHAIRHALPALGYVADDPCQPAQRVLLGEVIEDLHRALNENGTQP